MKLTKSNDLQRILEHPFAIKRKAEIMDIIAAGKAARFTIPHSGIWKDVKEWNIDSEGDLTAFRTSSNALLPLLCWYSKGYIMTQVELEPQPQPQPQQH